MENQKAMLKQATSPLSFRSNDLLAESYLSRRRSISPVKKELKRSQPLNFIDACDLSNIKVTLSEFISEVNRIDKLDKKERIREDYLIIKKFLRDVKDEKIKREYRK